MGGNNTMNMEIGMMDVCDGAMGGNVMESERQQLSKKRACSDCDVH